VSERWGERVSEGVVMVQLGMIVEICYELAP
jgi:hypothetical protein